MGLYLTGKFQACGQKWPVVYFKKPDFNDLKKIREVLYMALGKNGLKVSGQIGST
jgi:hypothetical protein